jgi:hypothetical protein
MLTISELLTSPTSAMRSTTDATTQTTECNLQLPSDMEAKNGPPSPIPTWRLPLPQLGIRSTPFQFLPSEGLGEKHRAAQDAATAAAVRCYSVTTTVRAAVQRIPYLWFTKWAQSANPVYDWEIQDSGNWTTPTESAPSAPSTAPCNFLFVRMRHSHKGSSNEVVIFLRVLCHQGTNLFAWHQVSM